MASFVPRGDLCIARRWLANASMITRVLQDVEIVTRNAFRAGRFC